MTFADARSKIVLSFTSVTEGGIFMSFLTIVGIGVLVATDETTLDPLTVNRNVNMLSDMFYGAMLAGGETELDGLFPMSLFPTVTQAQPFGDLANQFMQSVIAMNAQRKANSTLQQGTFSNPTKSGILVSNR
jgi:hypothetical protein